MPQRGPSDYWCSHVGCISTADNQIVGLSRGRHRSSKALCLCQHSAAAVLCGEVRTTDGLSAVMLQPTRHRAERLPWAMQCPWQYHKMQPGRRLDSWNRLRRPFSPPPLSSHTAKPFDGGTDATSHALGRKLSRPDLSAALLGGTNLGDPGPGGSLQLHYADQPANCAASKLTILLPWRIKNSMPIRGQHCSNGSEQESPQDSVHAGGLRMVRKS